MTIRCLFAKSRKGKYIFLDNHDQISFVHLSDLLFYLDGRFGKGTYRLSFDNIEEEEG